MSALDVKLARLLAAAVEMRAAAVDHADYLATTTPGPKQEVNSLATIQAMGRIVEVLNRASINIERNFNIAGRNASVEHGTEAVEAAADAGERLGKSDCPCKECRGNRPDWSLS